MKKSVLVFMSAIILCGAVSVALAQDKVSAAVNQACYFGIFRQGAPGNMGLINSLEKKTGKKFSVIMWYQDWSTTFNKSLCDKVVRKGAVPHIVWEPWLWSDKEKIKLGNILAGEWDSHIRQYAQDVRNWGKPIFIRWGHEFNIEGYPWCVVNNGKDPKKYVDAFRHVKNIFNEEGADNAMFVWCPMRESWPQEKWNDMELAYPGDEYVDWIGIDGYNWGVTQPWSQWQSFKELFRDVSRSLWRAHPTKPIMIAEFASADLGDDKAGWILDMNEELKKMPYIKAINWFDEKKEADWRIESTPKTLAAFKTLIKDPYFTASSAGIADIKQAFKFGIEKKKAVARYASTSVKIDADISDWMTDSFMTIDQESQIQEGANLWKSPSDLSAKVYLKWDNDNLYIAADVTDKNPLINSKKGKNIWNGDAIEICLGLDNYERSKLGDKDFQIGFSSGNGKLVRPSVWIWTNSLAPENADIAVVKTIGKNGYILEAKLPWAAMGSFRPSNGQKIGFDCAIDSASLRDRDLQMVWNGDYYFYKDPGVWGELEFAK
ncbi:MAG: glycosyl hydrolase [Candidatus Saganbacteria bacterium]|nr:glycosyl hydrolase [Candidatus Saganbacteria bacterium]